MFNFRVQIDNTRWNYTEILEMAYRSTDNTKNHKQTRRLELLNAAIKLISSGGFANLTIDAVAQSAGVAIGTVYKYFDSKAFLCAEVFRVTTATEVAIIDKIASGSGAPNQRLNRAIVTFSRRALRLRMQAYALIFEPIDPLVETERLKYRKAYAAIFERLLDEGIAAKVFADQSPSISATAIVGVISEALIGPLTWSSENAMTIDENQLIREIQTFCLRAVGAKVQ